MKRLGGFIVITAVLATCPLRAQIPTADDQLMAAVKELATKQAQLTDNQGKIETKVTDLAEAVRVARLFMARAGGPHIPPAQGTNIPAQKPPPK